MAVRDNLYSWFENFDKPDEDQFRVFIDSALLPTTYVPVTITPSSDILTDVNSQTFVLDIRECFIIDYGDNKYILYGLEGTYGLNGTEITWDNLTLIGSSSTGSLSTTLTANVNIPNAGIQSGDIFPAGTSYETLWRALLITNTISDLRYQANDISQFLEVGTSITITRFLWTVSGVPENLVLSDSDGQYNSSVTGTQVDVNEVYTYNVYKELVWTLSGSNVDDTTKTTYWVEASYYGANSTGSLPTEAQILGGVKVLTLTAGYISVPIDTTNEEYGWIAVPATQTGRIYNEWEVNVNSTADIGANEFIKYGGDVIVSGKTYNVYIYNWKSEVENLILV